MPRRWTKAGRSFWPIPALTSGVTLRSNYEEIEPVGGGRSLRARRARVSPGVGEGAEPGLASGARLARGDDGDLGHGEEAVGEQEGEDDGELDEDGVHGAKKCGRRVVDSKL